MPVSTKKAVTVAGVSISLVVIAALAIAVPVGSLIEQHTIPLYVTIPMLILLPSVSMGVFFHLVAIRWLIWAFKRVTDVYELAKMLHTSGFGAYGPGSLEKNHPTAFNEIKQRFESYEFVDDINVLSETTIYNKTFYQRGYFVFLSLLTIFTTIVAITFSGDEPNAAFIVPLLFAAFAVYQYIQIADRSPQLTLNEVGIQLSDSLLTWNDIRDYGIISGKTSYLTLYLAGTEKEIVIDYLNISKVQLNHLMFVYQQRHRKKSPKSR